jgi:hypothetical protein
MHECAYTCLCACCLLLLLTDYHCTHTHAHCTRFHHTLCCINAQVISYLVEDYNKRHETAMALLHELYVADFRATSALTSAATSSSFALYDTAFMALLRHLPTALLKSKAGQRLFVKTLLGCPRLPESAIALVCGFCDRSAQYFLKYYF